MHHVLEFDYSLKKKQSSSKFLLFGITEALTSSTINVVVIAGYVRTNKRLLGFALIFP